MSTEKKLLSLEEIEAQTGFALPDRELLHWGHHSGGHHSSGGHHHSGGGTHIGSIGGTNYINGTGATPGCSGNSSSGLLALTVPICPAVATGLQADSNTIPLTVGL